MSRAQEPRFPGVRFDQDPEKVRRLDGDRYADRLVAVRRRLRDRRRGHGPLELDRRRVAGIVRDRVLQDPREPGRPPG